MSVINQSDIEHIDEALRKFANQKNMNGFAAILIGFTDDGDHTCLIAKGELNRVDMLYCFSKGIQNLFERMDALKHKSACAYYQNSCLMQFFLSVFSYFGKRGLSTVSGHDENYKYKERGLNPFQVETGIPVFPYGFAA